MTKGVTASVKAAVLSRGAGKFTGGDYIGTLKNGGAAFIENPTFTPAVPASVISELKTLSTDIIRRDDHGQDLTAVFQCI